MRPQLAIHQIFPGKPGVALKVLWKCWNVWWNISSWCTISCQVLPKDQIGKASLRTPLLEYFGQDNLHICADGTTSHAMNKLVRCTGASKHPEALLTDMFLAPFDVAKGHLPGFNKFQNSYKKLFVSVHRRAQKQSYAISHSISSCTKH